MATTILNWTAEIIPRTASNEDDDFDYDAVVVYVNGHEVASSRPTDYLPYDGDGVARVAAQTIARLFE